MPTDRPRVSVLMNCFNGEKYLRPALESVLAQSYQDWELVFWDNQSTDASAAICHSYNDPRIRYFYASQHTELGAARIEAFKHLRGEFVAVLDADDVAHPERLRRQVALLEQRPDIALVGSWAQYIDENGEVFDEFRPPSAPDELLDCLGWTNPMVHSSVMYRYQTAVLVGGYSKDIVWGQDFALTLAIAQRFKIALIDDFLCQLRVLPASMTRSKKYLAIVANETLLLFRRAADTLHLSARARKFNRRALAIAEIKLGIATARNNAPLSGLLIIMRGLLSAPSLLWGNGPVRRFFGAKF